MNENGEIILAFDKETGELKEYVEPFATIEFQTEEDYKHFEEVLKFWKENHKEEVTNGTENFNNGGVGNGKNDQSKKL